MGDSVRDSGNPVIERLSKLETVSSIILCKLGDPFANVWVVEAPRFSGPFACYEGFLSSMSPCGDPLSYDPLKYPASTAITTMLHGCLAQIRLMCAEMNREDGGQQVDKKNENQQELRKDPQVSLPQTLLFGFSKGGVVLNQLLSELSFAFRSMQNHGRERTMERHESNQSPRPQEVICPATSEGFLSSIVEVHFLDVGLNCRGAYQTNVDVLEGVVAGAGTANEYLRLGFHGTPRQWSDPYRHWIADEKDFCISFLRKKADEKGNAKFRTTEKLYFEHTRPSLQMHFEILESFEMF
ncbi:hypothetical protein KP509_30G071600 [Ceratopteris richardii]|nr:hypothetical protein KP509_30G071600 [Ceratopteris richardii]